MTATGFFALPPIELERAAEFAKDHPYGCGRKTDFSIRFTATGLGVRVVITCHGCGQTADISDYDTW